MEVLENTLSINAKVDNMSICFDSGNASDDGSIVLKVLGGEPPLIYGWSNGGLSPAVYNLPFGTHNVTVTDARGCSVVKSYHVDCCVREQCRENDECEEIPMESLKVYFNVTPLTERNSSDGAIEVTVPGPNDFEIEWTDGNGNYISNELLISGLSYGKYCVKITNGCEVYNECKEIKFCGEVVWNIIPEIVKPCDSGPYLKSGSVTFRQSKYSTASPPFTYNWQYIPLLHDEHEVIEKISKSSTFDLPWAGLYTVTITDNNGCSTELSSGYMNGYSGSGVDLISCECVVRCNGKRLGQGNCDEKDHAIKFYNEITDHGFVYDPENPCRAVLVCPHSGDINDPCICRSRWFFVTFGEMRV